MNWLQARLVAFTCAFRGVVTLLRETAHARIHLLATVLVLSLAAYLELSIADWQALILTIALVWLAEGMNSALEYLCDAAVPEQSIVAPLPTSHNNNHHNNKTTQKIDIL